MTPLRIAAMLFIGSFAARADEGARFRANLVGTEETPAIFSAGSAEFRARVVHNDTQIVFVLTFENLSGAPAVAHVHFGQRNVAGGVSFFLCGGGGQPACPAATSGRVEGTVTAANVVGPTAQGIGPGNLAAILEMVRAGFGYANMHTARFPGGEIRGQIKATDGEDRD
jgi:CHRD domain